MSRGTLSFLSWGLIAVLATAAIAREGFKGPKRGWGPEQVTGEPDTPVAGDQTTAWASATPDGSDEWLELEYAAPVLADKVVIHETYNPGAVVKITGFTDSGMEAELWAGKDPTPRDAGKGVSEIAVKGMLETKRIRIHLNSKEVPGWNEIDAVGLKDAKGKIHWAVAAKASSTFAGAGGGDVFGGGFIPALPGGGFVGKPAAVDVGRRSWGTEQVLGEPNTKGPGDISTAWASSTPDDADEWLELEYAEAVKIETVQIFETYNPGAVYKVTGFNDAGKEIDLWEGKDPTDPSKEMGTSEIPVKGKLKTKKIRVYLKSTEVPGYNEIDAVGIKDAAGKVQWAIKANASSTYADGFGGGLVGGGLVEGDADLPMPAIPVPVRRAVPAVPAVRPGRVEPRAVEVRDPRIDKLEKEVAEFKASLAEIRKLLEKPR